MSRAGRFFEIEALRARALQEHAVELLAEALTSATYRVFPSADQIKRLHVWTRWPLQILGPNVAFISGRKAI
jgi:hypothetical protein